MILYLYFKFNFMQKGLDDIQKALIAFFSKNTNQE